MSLNTYTAKDLPLVIAGVRFEKSQTQSKWSSGGEDVLLATNNADQYAHIAYENSGGNSQVTLKPGLNFEFNYDEEFKLGIELL